MTYITIIEFHRRLGGALSLTTIYRMIEDGDIPGAIQPRGKGGKWLVPEDALQSIGKEHLEAST
jgi:excisionase family DNA binding protein